MELESEETNIQGLSSPSDFRTGSNSSKELETENSRFPSIRDSYEVFKASSLKTSHLTRPIAKETPSLLKIGHELISSPSVDNISKKTLSKISKSVSFRYSDELIPAKEQLTKEPSILNNDLTSSKQFKNGERSEILLRASVLEKIPEIDEHLPDENPGYFGWDGYEARFKDSLKEEDSITSIPSCIPPWAKSFRKAYGISPSESVKNLEEKTMREKIENLMKNHKELMLVKRVESKKQMIIEPSEYPDELDTVKMRAKSTRFYVAPLTTGGQRTSKSRSEFPDIERESSKISIPKLSDSEVSLTKKTPTAAARKEVSSVLKAVQKSSSKSQDVAEYHFRDKKDLNKCPKITLSDVREFVNMSPDERKLHQIIKIEKVPIAKDVVGSKTGDGRKLEPHYIINIPKTEITDRPTLNTIKIKEKRKLRVDSIENIEERVTELRYNQGTLRNPIKGRKSDLISRNEAQNEVGQTMHHKIKSPVETKTFQVQSKKTPVVDQREKTDKVLLIQYDKKSKRASERGEKAIATEIFGVKKAVKGKDEMYFYGSRNDAKETASKVEDIPPTLKQKVNMIFEEIRQMTFKPDGRPAEICTSGVQVGPPVSSKTTQRPSHQVATDVAMIQAVPEVKSAQMQTNQSQLSTLKSQTGERESFIAVPNSSPEDRAETVQSTIDETRLGKLLQDLASEEETENVEQIRDSTKKKSRKSTLSLKEEQEFMKMIEGNQPQENELEDIENDRLNRDSETVVTSEIPERSKDSKTKVIDVILAEESAITHLSFEPQEDMDEIVSTIPASQIVQEDNERLLRTSKEQTSTQDFKNKIEIKPKNDTTKSSSLLMEGKEILDKGKEAEFTKKEDIKKGSDTGSEVLRIPRQSDISKVSFAEDHDKVTYFRSQLIEDDDIRSYELSSDQGKELKIKSSSKFHNSKDSIRKKMNWTDDTIYLENNMCPQLMQGLAEVGFRQPQDPIAYLANWIYKQYQNREHQESKEVFTEHLELARTMTQLECGGAGYIQPQKKFHLKRYPLKDKSPDVSENPSFTKSQQETNDHPVNVQGKTEENNYYTGYPTNTKLESELTLTQQS